MTKDISRNSKGGSVGDKEINALGGSKPLALTSTKSLERIEKEQVMKAHGLENLSQLELDKIWIGSFHEPYRDTEMLSWDNLYFDSKYKVIRCNTCGCPAEICTCPKTLRGNSS